MKIPKNCLVKYLALYGMVMSVLGFIGSTALFGLTFLEIEQLVIGYVIMGSACVLVFFHLGWFFSSYLLHKKNTNNDMDGVKRIIKIGSFVIGAVQSVISALEVLIGFIIYLDCSVKFGVILILTGAIWLILSIRLLYGMWRRSPRVKPWIKFMFGMIPLFILVGSLDNYLHDTLLESVIGAALLFLYSSGMVIVHDYKDLEDENVVEFSAQSSSNDAPIKTALNIQIMNIPA